MGVAENGLAYFTLSDATTTYMPLAPLTLAGVRPAVDQIAMGTIGMAVATRPALVASSTQTYVLPAVYIGAVVTLKRTIHANPCIASTALP